MPPRFWRWPERESEAGAWIRQVINPLDALEAARKLAASSASVVAVSGAVDLIVGPDGQALGVTNGHFLLTRVNGGGCALGAVMAAFASLTKDPMLAATAATGVYTIAAEEAAARAQGPGSFAVEFLDGLAGITPDDVAAAAVAGGATIVQVRDKEASARELLQLLTAVAESVGDEVPVLVDDPVDIFLAARAAGAQVAGVHVGQSDLPIELVRALAGPGAMIG